MAAIPPNIFSEAVRYFWLSRKTQLNAQRGRGVSDQGLRGSVTGGKQMDGFAETIKKLLLSVGITSENIYVRKRTDLPGYFRPSKRWDIVVLQNGSLIAAIELKSQVGSLGNNFNNRTEEAMGTALDIWTAYKQGAFKLSPQPWIGYLLILEDSKRARTPIKVDEPHFQVFKEFQGASYAKRYELFCRRLVRERQYTAACFLIASESKTGERNYSEPAKDLSANAFLSQLLKHVAPI